MKSTKGLTFYICIGSYGGFSIRRDSGWRLVLGWVAFVILYRDIEALVQNLFIIRNKRKGEKKQE